MQALHTPTMDPTDISSCMPPQQTPLQTPVPSVRVTGVLSKV